MFVKESTIAKTGMGALIPEDFIKDVHLPKKDIEKLFYKYLKAKKKEGKTSLPESLLVGGGVGASLGLVPGIMVGNKKKALIGAGLSSALGSGLSYLSKRVDDKMMDKILEHSKTPEGKKKLFEFYYKNGYEMS